MLALCWHNMPAHYAFYYASIFDGGLIISIQCILHLHYHQVNYGDCSIRVRRSFGMNFPYLASYIYKPRAGTWGL